MSIKIKRIKFWDFAIQTDHSIPARRLDLVLINIQKRTCQIIDFAVSADYRVKVKEGEKLDKYLELARELKRPWNMKVNVILVVVGTFGTVLKNLKKRLDELEIKGRIGTIPITARVKSARTLRRVLNTEEICCHLNSSKKVYQS